MFIVNFCNFGVRIKRRARHQFYTDNVFNLDEEIVKSLIDDGAFMNKGELKKAIGRDMDGNYLVNYDGWCYFYSPKCFEVVEDKKGLLSKTSVYYGFGMKL